MNDGIVMTLKEFHANGTDPDPIFGRFKVIESANGSIRIFSTLRPICILWYSFFNCKSCEMALDDGIMEDEGGSDKFEAIPVVCDVDENGQQCYVLRNIGDSILFEKDTFTLYLRFINSVIWKNNINEASKFVFISV